MQLDRLARVVSTGRLGNPKSLPNDVLKVLVLAGYESAAGGKRKAPHQVVGGLVSAGLVELSERTKRFSFRTATVDPHIGSRQSGGKERPHRSGASFDSGDAIVSIGSLPPIRASCRVPL